MTAFTVLIATLLSAGDPTVPANGFSVGFSGAAMINPSRGGNGIELDSGWWGSVQVGWSFGERFVQGPELEAGFWQYHLADVEVPSASENHLRFHLGFGYRVAIDLLRGPTTAFFLSGRLAAGAIPLDGPSSNGALDMLYLQTNLAAGLRVALGPVRLRFELGPGFGLYGIWDLVDVRAGVAVEW